jgi:O-antigen ligase
VQAIPVAPAIGTQTAGRLTPRAARAAPGSLRIVRDPLRLTLFVTTILTISRLHQHYSFLAKFRPLLLLVLIAGAYAYLNPGYLTRLNVLKLWPMRLVALLTVLACGSAVFGISLGATASFILNYYLKTVIFAFLITVSIRNVQDLYTFVWAYVISCGILVFFSLFVFKITQSANSYVSRLDHLDTYDSNDLCVVLVIGLALTLLLLGFERGWRRGLLVMNLVGIAASVARSGSRGGFIGIIIFGLAALILINTVSVSGRLAMLGAATIALMIGAPPGYWKQMSTVLEPSKDYNYSARDGRKALIIRGIGYMRAYPVFGLGISNFSRAECTISPKLEGLSRTGPIRCMAPHNSWLQAGAELGYPGFIAWSWLVIGAIVSMLRLRPRLPQSWRRGNDAERFMYGATHFLPLAMIGFAVTSFFVSFAWMDPLYILSALVAGWYIVARGAVTLMEPSQANRLAVALGLVRKTSAGWRSRRSGRWFTFSPTSAS